MSTRFAENPFRVLGVWATDSKEQLNNVLSRARLLGDARQVSLAHQQLVNLSQRVSAEVRWFPGVSPEARSVVDDALEQERVPKRDLEALPTLARANLMFGLTELALANPDDTDAELVEVLCVDLVSAWSAVTADGVHQAINADRASAGFVALADVEPVKAALSAWSGEYRRLLRRGLSVLEVQEVASVLLQALDRDEVESRPRPSALLIGLIDDYEVRARPKMEEVEGEIDDVIANISELIEKEGAGSQIDRYVDQLVEAIFEWDAIAQPIQVLKQRELKKHDRTLKLHQKVRAIAIDLTNDRGMVKASKRLTEAVAEAFQEERSVAQTAAEDLETLSGILQRNRPANQKSAAWAKAITWESRSQAGYLRISPEGVQFRNDFISLEDITKFRLTQGNRWPGIILSGPHDYIRITFSSGKTLNAFIPKLIRAIADDIYDLWHHTLENRKTVKVGPVVIQDDGVFLTRRRTFRGDENVLVPWHRVQRVDQQGGFLLRDSRDARLSAELSYFHADNVFLLEVLINRMRDTKHERISDFF